MLAMLLLVEEIMEQAYHHHHHHSNFDCTALLSYYATAFPLWPGDWHINTSHRCNY